MATKQLSKNQKKKIRHARVKAATAAQAETTEDDTVSDTATVSPANSAVAESAPEKSSELVVDVEKDFGTDEQSMEEVSMTKKEEPQAAIEPRVKALSIAPKAPKKLWGDDED